MRQRGIEKTATKGKRRGAIDIGSNSVRLLIGQVEEGYLTVNRQELRTTRLGKTPKGEPLDREAVAKTLSALEEFRRILQEMNIVEPPVVAATSAVREAADGDAFARLLTERLGWRLRILTGADEARYSYVGAAAVVGENAAVLDVGGGSTELIVRKKTGICCRSVPVGAVRLHLGEIQRRQLPLLLRPLAESAGEQLETPFVGVGGTITSLAAMKNHLVEYRREWINGTVLTQTELRAYGQEADTLAPQELLARYPLLQKRGDILGDGIAIYLALMELLGFSRIVVSDAGILDGLLLEAAKE